MKEPIRVLQVLGGTGLGGAESRVMDLYRSVDRTQVQFDFAVHNAKRDHFDDEIEALGGHIYRLPRFRVYNWLAYRRAWENFFREHPGYVCVHGHMTSTASVYLPAAKRAGVARTVAHARSAGTDSGMKGRLTRLMRRNLWKKTDFCFACSALAGKAVFGEKAWKKGLVHVIPNALAVEKFAYDPDKREEMRSRLQVQDCFVVGHVGRFNPMKNHPFLLEIFAQIQKERKDAALLLLGVGSGMDAAKETARRLGIGDRVHFLGNRENVADYYQAMDFLVFPSLYEGMPGTVLEAQAAGLPCLIADTITPEVKVTGLVQTMSLEAPAREWARKVAGEPEALAGAGERQGRAEELKQAGFDVSSQAGRMTAFYEKGEPLW